MLKGSMPTEQLGLSNDPYNSERAVLSIQDMYIKQEQSDAKNNDMLILNAIEDLSENGQDFALGADEVISSTENICMDLGNAQQLLGDFNKMPIELSVACKPESIKMERSHFIKYLVRDGKHIKVWECGICAKEFGHQYTLMRHLPTHTDERKFQCNTCGKAFRQMSTLSQHRAIHSAERPYVCEVCRKTFNRVSTLISHRKTHTGLKPHRCHLCNKAFHQKGNLRNHIFTHTNERPYKCDVCGKGFNQMSNLMCHKLKAHQRADKPRYTCSICGTEFPKRMALRNHEQYQHGVTVSNDALPNLPHPQLPTLEHCPQGAVSGAPAQPTRVRYTNGVLVEPINTDAMKMAMRTGQTPFALLRPLNGIPVLVRVLPAGEKQMLVPATAEDLRRHGQITITATPNNEQQESPVDGSGDATLTTVSNNNGSTVQIKIPVVATVVQRCSTDGSLCMAVQSPGPKDNAGDGYVIATSEGVGDQAQLDHVPNLSNEMILPDTIIDINAVNPTLTFRQDIPQDIQYLDETGNIISEEEYNAKSQTMSFNPEDFTFPSENSFIPTELSNVADEIAPESASNVTMSVESALDALDKMMDNKEIENGFDTTINLSENNQTDSITIYGESSTNMLYGSCF